MDTVTEALPGSDMDAEMTVLTPADVTEQNLDASDEVEDLRNRYKSVISDILFWILLLLKFSVQ